MHRPFLFVLWHYRVFLFLALTDHRLNRCAMNAFHKIFTAAAAVLLLAGCQKDLPPREANPDGNQPALELKREIEPLNGREPLEKSELVRRTKSFIESRGVFDWGEADDFTVWSAVIATDSIISLGYQPAGFAGLDEAIHEIDVRSGEWQNLRRRLINYVLERYRRLYPDRNWRTEDVVAFGEKPLPYLNLRVWDYETLAHLRNFTVTRYCEPMGFGIDPDYGDRSDSGCGGNLPAPFVPSDHFHTAPQGATFSWNYIPMRIQRAWKAGARGAGVTVGLIDTGNSPDQAKLNDEFSGGFSGNRTIETLGFHTPCSWFFFCENDGPYDLCGHGTSMGGVLAGPFSGDGAPSGVAFRSNMISIRATEDVVHNTSAEKNGVSDAYYYLGSREDVDIISMSLGDLFSSGQITDAVNYAHNQEKMIFCAAGTSFSWTTFVGVIFPANLDNTIAVTGIKTGSLNNMQKCTSCHSGSQVDFAVTMEDQNDESKRPLTLANSGIAPTYTGGSSVATATAAGIAALVWSTDLGQSREEVLDRMKAASNFYPSRDSEFGWGRINAEAATQ